MYFDSSDIEEKSEIWEADIFEFYESVSDSSVDFVAYPSCSPLAWCLFKIF